jgi:hypothetical protein
VLVLPHHGRNGRYAMCVQTGLDMQLFTLLDWCIASSVTACTSSPYWGVELRSGVDRVVQGSTRSLQREIEQAIESLVAVEVPNKPDKFSTEWVLLSRVIALGLRGGAVVSQEQDKDGEQGDEHEDEHKAEGSAAIAETPTAMSTLQFSNWCRDNSLVRGKDVEVSRVRVKCVALKCATSALTTCKTELSPVHSDIRSAKAKTQELLGALGSATPDAAALNTLPCYLALFLHDLVNFGCACASFSVEDHRMLELQTVAIEFLNALMQLFWNTIDPDDHSRPVDAVCVIVPAEQKILMQFMAQIVSAVRPALSSKWAPNLQWTAGGLVFSIILDGLLNDKVVVRRLAKILLHGLEGEGAAAAFKPRAAFALEVAGEVSTIEHIVGAANMARLFLLTSEYGQAVGCVDKNIQEALLTMLTPHLPAMQSVWLGLAIDAARVLQSQTTWPKSLPVTDCRRGGISYSPEVDPVKLVWHLEYALPFVGAAVSLSGNIPKENVAALFAINVALLGHLNDHAVEAGSSVAHVEGNSFIRGMKGALEPIVLASLKAIAVQCTLHSEPDAELKVPLSEWAQLATFLTNDIATNFFNVSLSSFAEFSIQCDLIIQIADTLLSYLMSTSSGNAGSRSEDQLEERAHLSSRLWVLAITMAQIVFGGLFPHFSADEYDVTTGNSVYPQICQPKKGATDNNVSQKLWLNTSIGCKVAKSTVAVLEKASRAVGHADTTVYAATLLVALLPYVSAVAVDVADKAGVLGALVEAVQQVRNKAVVSDVLMQEMFSLSCPVQSDELLADDRDLAECARVLFGCWLRVGCEEVSEVSKAWIDCKGINSFRM